MQQRRQKCIRVLIKRVKDKEKRTPFLPAFFFCVYRVVFKVHITTHCALQEHRDKSKW